VPSNCQSTSLHMERIGASQDQRLTSSPTRIRSIDWTVATVRTARQTLPIRPRWPTRRAARSGRVKWLSRPYERHGPTIGYKEAGYMPQRAWISSVVHISIPWVCESVRRGKESDVISRGPTPFRLQASPRATDRYSAATTDHGLTSLHTTLFFSNTMIASALLLPLLALRVSAVSSGLETLLFDAPALRAPDGALSVSASVFTYRADTRAGELESALARPVRPLALLDVPHDAALATARACAPAAGEIACTSHACPFATVNTNARMDRRRLRSYLLIPHACTKHPHISVYMRVGHGVDDYSMALALGSRMIHTVSKDSRRSTCYIWSFYRVSRDQLTHTPGSPGRRQQIKLYVHQFFPLL
jgi:hypothetical protein